MGNGSLQPFHPHHHLLNEPAVAVDQVGDDTDQKREATRYGKCATKDERLNMPRSIPLEIKEEKTQDWRCSDQGKYLLLCEPEFHLWLPATVNRWFQSSRYLPCRRQAGSCPESAVARISGTQLIQALCSTLQPFDERFYLRGYFPSSVVIFDGERFSPAFPSAPSSAQ